MKLSSIAAIESTDFVKLVVNSKNKSLLFDLITLAYRKRNKVKTEKLCPFSLIVVINLLNSLRWVCAGDHLAGRCTLPDLPEVDHWSSGSVPSTIWTPHWTSGLLVWNP